MAVCPACGENAIGAMSKLFSDEMFCVRCKACGGYAYVPSWLMHFTNYTAPELLSYAGIVAGFVYYLSGSLIPLFAVLAAAFTYAVHRIYFGKMVSVSQGEAQTRLRWGLIVAGTGFIVLVALVFR